MVSTVALVEGTEIAEVDIVTGRARGSSNAELLSVLLVAI